MNDPRRRIPSIDRLLGSESFVPLVAAHGRGLALKAARFAVAKAKRELLAEVAGDSAVARDVASPSRLARVAEAWLTSATAPSLRRVINATGVVIHTNLGRAPLARSAVEAMASVAAGYSNLEYDVEAGSRGSRYSHCVSLLRELTGADGALVVNNAAAALVLATNALAGGGGVVVSRGELIEIGGGFRIPDMLERAGARLIPVGSTNRTRASDYTAGLDVHNARLVLKVHRSNFRVSGFTEEVGVAELAATTSERGVPLVHDLGSGLLDREAAPTLDEPTPRESLVAGSDLVVFSGDKLIGAPQAGVIVGREDLVGALRGNPLCRALRVDKTTLAALEATLRLHRQPTSARSRVPVLAMLTASADELARRAERMVAELTSSGVGAEVVSVRGRVGGGACPDVELAGAAVALSPANGPPSGLAEALRLGEPPVVARIEGERLILDPRTVLPEDEEVLVRRVADVARGYSGASPDTVS